MSLRQRILVTLLAITAVLVVPALYGIVVLRDLREIARDLRTRDAGALLELGRVQGAIRELELAEAGFVSFPDDPERLSRVDAMLARSAALVEQLANRPGSSGEYQQAVDAAKRQLRVLERSIQAQRAELAAGVRDSLATYHRTVVQPAFAAMDGALDPIATAIRAQGTREVERAQEVTRTAATTTIVALVIAVGLAVLMGMLMTQALLKPIQELRGGMSRVAQGDFTPRMRPQAERPDELGDLARSFSTMTTQLAELDRLKAEVVSVASHEIKTPLSVIRGYVSLLADGIYGPVSDTQRKTLSAISDQVDRLTRLIHRLLDISRFEAGGGRLEVRRINVRDFLEELTGGFRVLALQNGVDFTVHVADDVPVNIEGDPDRLNEVLGNILSNAFKFTQRGGSVRLDARREGAGVAIEVTDTGVGIPADKLPRIFEKFYQVENEAQPRSAGSGLGLAIAREIMEAHGGTIGAASEEGKGAVFRVVLPERPPPAGRSGRTSPPHRE